MDPPSLVSKESLPDLWALPQATADYDGGGGGGDGGGMLWTRSATAGGVPMGHNSFFAAVAGRQAAASRDDPRGRKRRDSGPPLVAASEDDSSKLISSCSGNELTESEAKRLKADGQREDGHGEEPKAEAEVNSGACHKRGNQASQSSVAPKQDYIHVRARRGQATDSHSLAERARREKISERMKILQDLVPGCNKVIGKALVLDEIINYIQSLQHQVEFLSMKLEALSAPTSHSMEGFPEDAFDTTSRLAFNNHPPPPREYGQGSSEWLHMQVGPGFKRAAGS
ncbi:unnamed protein product [Spirodela intermedia]|uniref:BHLH domain-containing protein n=1 Tax=Spirodela intermedia TaxID=51605 RepID=A0A7I8JBB8_SPIIN|nr:unnamed protein product [Spirodela intermedia]CAA6667281.1 unnamed protein product [Spirodela intermedia]